jgi:hypothetical protein
MLLLICMSFVEQFAPTKARSLCARKEKWKKNSPKMLLLPELSSAIDV